MDGSYEIYLGDRPVGRAAVKREGLYYYFSCRCSLSGEAMYRLMLARGGQETDLGLCVPLDGSFGTEKRIPVKQCGEGAPHFYLRPKGADRKGRFIPLSPEEPFAYIHRLENAFLERRGVEMGIFIPDLPD